MKKEELFEVLGNLEPGMVEKARSDRHPRRGVWKKWTAAAACAVIIGGAVLGVTTWRNGREGSVVRCPSGVTTVLAAYPASVARTMDAQKFMESDAHWDWWDSYRELTAKSAELQSGIDAYYQNLMKQMLVSEDENTVCSPINLYIAFAMLAETSDGNTRQQILDMLGAQDMDTLRENVSSLWESNYADTPALKSVLANSLWLDGEETYNDTTLQRLAEQYYASTFRGTPGSEEMNQALRTWTDDNTGGLLKEYTENMAIAPETVFELVSTIYYKAMWRENFWEVNTEKETFHGAAGDTTVDMMKKTEWMDVYQGEHFRAVSLSLQDSGSMYFLLPDENTDVNELVSDPDLMKVIRRDESSDNWYSPMVNLSVPKFKVSEKTDLIETVRALGVTDALDADLADFSPLTGDKENLYLSKADHAAMLEIDENGVTGAAYTELGVSEAAAEIPDDEIDFGSSIPVSCHGAGRIDSVFGSCEKYCRDMKKRSRTVRLLCLRHVTVSLRCLFLLCVPLSEQKNRQNQYSRENAAGQHTCLQIVAGVLCDKSNNKWANGTTHISGHGEKCEQCSSAEWNFRG